MLSRAPERTTQVRLGGGGIHQPLQDLNLWTTALGTPRKIKPTSKVVFPLRSYVYEASEHGDVPRPASTARSLPLFRADPGCRATDVPSEGFTRDLADALSFCLRTFAGSRIKVGWNTKLDAWRLAFVQGRTTHATSNCTGELISSLGLMCEFLGDVVGDDGSSTSSL